MITAGAEPEPYFEVIKQIEAFTLQYTQDELFEEGLSRGIYIAPILDIEGLLKEQHFHSREYWETVRVLGKSARLPGAFAKLSASPLSSLDSAP